MSIVLFDTVESHTQLLPLSYTRSGADMRVGILTIKEKWERYLGQSVQVLTETYLQPKYGNLHLDAENLFIAANVLPTPQLVAEIQMLSGATALSADGKTVAFRSSILPSTCNDIQPIAQQSKFIMVTIPVQFVASPSAIFKYNAQEIAADFK